jgi:hypothetical protein
LLLAGTSLITIITLVPRALRLRWRRDALSELPLQPGGWLGALVIVAASAVLHEALQLFGWLTLGKTSPASVS